MEASADPQEDEPDAPQKTERETATDVRGASAAHEAADHVAPGTRIGRYMIVDVVGSGGVGVVYSAYDPDLDRKVALKQLRRSKQIGQTVAVNQRRTRLRREAQALARLSHPNVVPVYEVATVDEQIYVVMEFVEGQTLGEWLEERERSWSEIVGMFIQAGRGLAAAHAADIVHRDFKPDNVRVGTDGRARVLDFGLAGPLRDADTEESARAVLQELWESSHEESWSDSGSRSIGQVTREGQVMGTPAYMAPEQASGGHVDARSDQFSFCVALYEALYGVRPFRGRFDNPRRFRSLAKARVLPGKRPSDMPIDIERTLIRGLSLLPEQRFEAMEPLLAELAAVAEGPRRLWWVPVSIMLLAMLAVIAFYERRSDPGVACEDGGGLLEGVWDDAVRGELEGAALASTLPYAGATWEDARARFDDWSEAWSRERERACEATHVAGEQTPELLERRVACLDQQLIRIESMVAGLRRIEAEPDDLIERLGPLELPIVDSCAAANVLEQSSLEPRDPEAASRAAAIRQLLAGVEGLTEVGEYSRALAQGERALEQARDLGHEPVLAEAELLLGLAIDRQHGDEDRAVALLRDAAWAAQRSGHDRVLIRAAAALASTLGTDQAKLEQAQTWAELARATFVHHGEDLDIEAEVRGHLGQLAMTSGDYDAALSEYGRALEHARVRQGERSRAHIEALRSIGNAHQELGHYAEAAEALGRARELARASLGEAHPLIPAILDALGNNESAQGRFDEALVLHRAALEINEQLYGPEHRRVAKNLNNLAIIYDETGRYNDALATLERARTILVKELGADHPDVAFVDVNVGSALQNLDRHDEALARYEAALSVLEDSLGPEHMAVGVTLQNLGSVRSRLGDHRGALTDFTRSQAVLEQAFGSEHPTIAALEYNRAAALRALDRHDEALAAGQRALTMREAIFGREHSELVEVLSGLAKTELALGNEQRAREHLERALELVGDGNTPTEHAEVCMTLAELLVADPQTRERAGELVRAALAALREAEVQAQDVAVIEEWLADHGFE